MRKCEVKVTDKATCNQPSVGTVDSRATGRREVCDKHWDRSDIRF